MIIPAILVVLIASPAWAEDCNTCREMSTNGIQECTLLHCLPPILHEARVKDSDGHILMTCKEDLTDCRGPLVEQNTCYRRMQEAMRMVQQAREREGLNITYIIEGVEYTRWSLTEAQRHRWLDVVEQCVEGKP